MATSEADPVAEVLLQLGGAFHSASAEKNGGSKERTNASGGSSTSSEAGKQPKASNGQHRGKKDSDGLLEADAAASITHGNKREERLLTNVINNHAQKKLETFLWSHPRCESNLAQLSKGQTIKTKIHRKAYPDVFDDALEVADGAPLQQYHSQMPGAGGIRAPRTPPFGYFSFHPSTLSLHPAHATHQFYPSVPPSSNTMLFANLFQQQMLAGTQQQQQQLQGFRQLGMPNATASPQMQLNPQQMQMLHMQQLHAQQQQQMMMQQQQLGHASSQQQQQQLQQQQLALLNNTKALAASQDPPVPPPPALGPPRVSQSHSPLGNFGPGKHQQQDGKQPSIQKQAMKMAQRPSQRRLDDSDDETDGAAAQQEAFLKAVALREREKQNAIASESAAASNAPLNHNMAMLQNKNAETLHAVIAAGSQSTDPRAVAMSRAAATILHRRQMNSQMASSAPKLDMNNMGMSQLARNPGSTADKRPFAAELNHMTTPGLSRQPSGTISGDKRPFSALALAAAAGRMSSQLPNTLGLAAGVEAPSLSRQQSYDVQRLLLAKQEQVQQQGMDAPGLMRQPSTEVQRLLLAREAQAKQQQQNQAVAAHRGQGQEPQHSLQKYPLADPAKKSSSMADAYDLETLERCPKMPLIKEDRDRQFPIDESELTGCDILLGRGGMTNHHDGNVEWRRLVSRYRPVYVAARKGDKGQLAKTICNYIRYRKGRFLQRNEEDSLWYEVGDSRARGKCAQALREGTAEIAKQMQIQQDGDDNGAEEGHQGEGLGLGEKNSYLAVAPTRALPQSPADEDNFENDEEQDRKRFKSDP